VLFTTGRHKDAMRELQLITSSRELDVAEQVLHAELLCARGDFDASMDIAQPLLLRSNLTDLQRSQLRFTLGQVCFDRGHVTKGIEHFRSGADLASKSGNLVEECRLRVQLLRNEIRWMGLRHAGAGLESLRRKIHQSASPSMALFFHIALTEFAARLSLLPRAREHLETGRALLSEVTNLDFHRHFRHTEIALTAAEGATDEALHLALAWAQEVGTEALSVNMCSMTGHLLVMQARFDEAEEWLRRASERARVPGGREIGILDNVMFLRLSQGDLPAAGIIAESIRRMVDDNDDLRDSTYYLWHVVIYVRWLYSLGRFDEGLGELNRLMPRIVRLADRRLLSRTKLLNAEGLGKIGKRASAITLVGEVLEEIPEPPLEVLGEAARTIGGLVANEHPAVAAAYLDRAEETMKALGNKALADTIRDERRGSVHLDQPRTAVDRSISSDWTERMAGILSAGGHPPLLASMTQALISETGAAVNVTLRRPEARKTAPTNNSIRIALGVHLNTHYELHVEPAATAIDHATLLAIARIVRSSVELANARRVEREHAALWPTQSATPTMGLICSSEKTLDLLKTIQRVAATSVAVLLTGETGVGKELFARALHVASPRNDRVFLPFNCSTVPREVIDSQLFGHKRGSFTGAVSDSPGVIRAAVGGTLFLDEIGEMAIDTQPKLLRFLESGEVLPLGDTKPQQVDVRVVAATNANLDQLVADGRFREDLFYRLNVVRIDIPPLRERREEIPALVDHFLERFGQELDKPLLRIADETLEYLVLYRWPGNVRQLANEIRRLVAMAEPGAVIMPAHLSNDVFESRKTVPADRPARLFDEVVTRIDQPLTAAVEHIERAAIQRALAVTNGHLDEAARILGLSRKGLYLKRQRLNLG